MQVSPSGQSSLVAHAPAAAHDLGDTQTHPLPSTRGKQKQSPTGSVPQPSGGHARHVSGHRSGYAWANAGVLRLDRTGADHAIAAPAPTRFSILLREMRSSKFFIHSLPRSVGPDPSSKAKHGLAKVPINRP
jgi:hypothetical protein